MESKRNASNLSGLPEFDTDPLGVYFGPLGLGYWFLGFGVPMARTTLHQQGRLRETSVG